MTLNTSPTWGEGFTPGALFQLFRDGKPRTRAGLTEQTGWSRSTINSRVDQLLSCGLIGPCGESQSTGGRPSAQFAFDPAAHLVIGIDLGASHAAVALTDMAGKVVANRSADLPIAAGPKKVLGWVLENVADLVKDMEVSGGRLIAAGVGLPGAVDFPKGRVVSTWIMPGWDDYPVSETLAEGLGLPVTVDNDANVLALGEHRWHWPQVENLLFVKAATGIGSGIIAGGLTQRGAIGAAGDLGHFVVDSQSDVICPCGNRGCLEAVASAAALADRLFGGDKGDLERLFAAARAGERRVAQAVRDAARYIGAVVGSAVSLLNPSVVVIGGRMTTAGEPFLAGLREAIYQSAVPLSSRNLRVVESRMGALGGVLGASTLSIDQALSVESINRLLA